AFGGSICNGIQKVGSNFFGRDLDIGIDRFGLRVQYFGKDYGPGGGHDGGRQKVFGKDQSQGRVVPAQKADISGQYGSGNGGHSPHHHQEDFRSVHLFQVGLDQ